ncbi:MAG: sigma-70 family RNA polymerase sigma factor [Planctomycetota bacterium]|nr:sigma-70 family RNA polymerase sigma factor [Planctomycetota bacterium]
MTDRTLLEAYADTGDSECLGIFLKRYETSLIRFVSNFLGDEGIAQDIVQETFLKVARRPGKLLGVTSFHSWLLKVARNQSIDHLRRVIRQRKHSSRLQQETASQADTVIETLEHSERSARVRMEIDRLRPKLKEVMLLKVQESKSYREIAEITGLTVTNVGYLVHQAMQALRSSLRDLREDT